VSNSKRAYLSHEILRKITLNLCDRHKTKKAAAKAIEVNPAQIYRYLNGGQCSIPVKNLLKILRILGLSEITLQKIEPSNEYRKRSISKANAQLKQPYVSFNSIAVKRGENLSIDVLEWLSHIRYIQRTKRMKGVAQLKEMSVNNDTVVMEYEVFRKNRFIKHLSVLPRFLRLDIEMMYFLGLWSGDNARGRRVGIVNKNLCLLKKTSELLQKCLKQPQSLLIGNVMFQPELSRTPKLQYQKLMAGLGIKNTSYTINPKCYGGHVFTVCSHNSLLKRLLDFLKTSLFEIFSMTDAVHRGSFYAGLFDADGNVNSGKKGINFRWAARDMKLVQTLMTWLEKDGFMPKYDGANVKIGCKKETRKVEFQRFKELIMPHICHPQKHRAAQELLKVWR